MYEMPSGQNPYQADSALDLMSKHAQELFSPLPHGAALTLAVPDL